jgi:Tfp pilus assembly protein PilN
LGAVVCFFLLVALWLTFLTNQNRKQAIQNEILKKERKSYIKEIEEIKRKLRDNGKES